MLPKPCHANPFCCSFHRAEMEELKVPNTADAIMWGNYEYLSNWSSGGLGYKFQRWLLSILWFVWEADGKMREGLKGTGEAFKRMLVWQTKLIELCCLLGQSFGKSHKITAYVSAIFRKSWRQKTTNIQTYMWGPPCSSKNIITNCNTCFSFAVTGYWSLSSAMTKHW